MLCIPNLILIGGNCRNVGKTTLACGLIRKFAQNHEVIGLKVTQTKPDEALLHGNHSHEPKGDFHVLEETSKESSKDTSLMLMAGASKVFYIRAAEGHLEKSFLLFLENLTDNQPIICESRSLRDILIPGLFFMLVGNPLSKTAKDVSTYISKADKVIFTFNHPIDFQEYIENVGFSGSGFFEKY